MTPADSPPGGRDDPNSGTGTCPGPPSAGLGQSQGDDPHHNSTKSHHQLFNRTKTGFSYVTRGII